MAASPSAASHPPQLSPPDSHGSNTSANRLSPHPVPPLSPSSQSAFAPLLSQLSSLQADLMSELEEEFAASKLDVNSVKDICRYFLSEYVKVGIKWQERHREKEREAALPPQLSLVPDALLVAVPLIQPQWRVRMWKILLGCHNKDESLVSQYLADHPEAAAALSPHRHTADDDLGGEADDLPGLKRRRSEKEGHQAETIAQEKLIHRDVTRTRPHDPRLLPEYRSGLTLLLTFYCRSRGVAYKQGLNEILTPLLIMAHESAAAAPSPPAAAAAGPPSSPLDVSYNLFYSLISRFLPAMFADSDFENLRCIFRSFRLLLLYFDPVLARHVDSHNILPELYATPWFITLFARDLHVDVLSFLWDVYLIEDDPFLHYFLALALLMQQRDRLLHMDASSLPVSLRKLQLQSLLPLLSHARSLREQTPASMRQHLYDINFTVKQPEVMEMISTYDSLLPSLAIPATELVQAVHADLADTGPASVKILPLDVREKRQWENGHLATAQHINPCCLFTPGGVERVLQRFSSIKGQHICIIGNEMRTYNTLVGMAGQQAQAAQQQQPSVSATPVLDGFLAAVRETSMEAVEAHRMYLTPKELMEMEREDLKREAGRKWQQGKGAAPPVAAVALAVGPKGVRAPSPAQALPLISPPVSLPASPLGSAASSPTSSSSPAEPLPIPSSSSATPPPSSTPEPQFKLPATAAPPAVFSFPATSPIMDPYTASFVHLFLQAGFTHVSVCEGGYPAAHELVMSIRREREKARRLQQAAFPASAAAAVQTAVAPSIELVDHTVINCLCCSPHLYEKWREERVKRRQEAEKKERQERQAAEKKALQEKQAAEKERERQAKLQKEEEERKAQAAAKEEAELKAKAERQRRRDAGEVVEEPAETTAAAAATPASVPATAGASEKLHSLGRWLSDKSKAVAATATKPRSGSRGHSPAPSISLAPPEEKQAPDTVEKKEQQLTDGAADKQQAAAVVSFSSSSASSYFGKLESQARALAKKLSDSGTAASAAAPAPPVAALPPLSEKERLTQQHRAEKRAEREQSVSVDLREWMQDGQLSLFSAHEVRKIAGSTQGLLIPRVLAISSGYVISLRPDTSKAAGKDREKLKRDPAKEAAATASGGGGGWFDRVVGAVAAATASAPATAATAAATSSKPPPAVPVAQAAAAAPSSSAFSLAPAEDPALLLENSVEEPQPQPETETADDASAQLASPSSSSSASAGSSVPFSPSSSSSAPLSISGVSLTSPTNEAFSIQGSPFAFIHSKRRITELDRITSKKDRPCLLTFHWKAGTGADEDAAAAAPSSSSGQTLYVIDRPKECIDIVKRKYARAKRVEREKQERSSAESTDGEDEAEEEKTEHAATKQPQDQDKKEDGAQHGHDRDPQQQAVSSVLPEATTAAAAVSVPDL